jgi:hypothetical protein
MVAVPRASVGGLLTSPSPWKGDDVCAVVRPERMASVSSGVSLKKDQGGYILEQAFIQDFETGGVLDDGWGSSLLPSPPLPSLPSLPPSHFPRPFPTLSSSIPSLVFSPTAPLPVFPPKTPPLFLPSSLPLKGGPGYNPGKIFEMLHCRT